MQRDNIWQITKTINFKSPVLQKERKKQWHFLKRARLPLSSLSLSPSPHACDLGIDLSVPSWRMSQSLKCIWSRKEREVKTVPEVQWAKMHRCILCRSHFRARNTKEEWHTAGTYRVYVQQQDLTNAPFIFHLTIVASSIHIYVQTNTALLLKVTAYSFTVFFFFLIAHSKCYIIIVHLWLVQQVITLHVSSSICLRKPTVSHFFVVLWKERCVEAHTYVAKTEYRQEHYVIHVIIYGQWYHGIYNTLSRVITYSYHASIYNATDWNVKMEVKK